MTDALINRIFKRTYFFACSEKQGKKHSAVVEEAEEGSLMKPHLSHHGCRTHYEEDCTSNANLQSLDQ